MILRAFRPGFTFLAVLALTGGMVWAAESPVTQVQFELTMARKMGEVCEDLAFDETGYGAYVTELAESAGADVADFTAQVEASPNADALVPHYEAFILRHEGALFSSRPAFCRAGAREIGEGTGIGRMLTEKGD